MVHSLPIAHSNASWLYRWAISLTNCLLRSALIEVYNLFQHHLPTIVQHIQVKFMYKILWYHSHQPHHVAKYKIMSNLKVFIGKPQGNIHPAHFLLSTRHPSHQIEVNHHTHILKVPNNINLLLLSSIFYKQQAYPSANLIFIQLFHSQWSMSSNIPSSVETC